MISLQIFFSFFYRLVLSRPYSRERDGNRNWRFRVVDISVQIYGSPALLEPVQEALEGATSALHGMEFG